MVDCRILCDGDMKKRIRGEMLEEALIALAALGGQTVVAAATTDAWQACKRGFARLLGRGDPNQTQATERRLDDTRELLARAQGADLEQVRTALASTWATRLADLLEDDSGIEAGLRTLVQEIQAVLPAGAVSASGHAVAAGRDVNIGASSGGVAAGVIHGNGVAPNPTNPGSAHH